MKCSGKDENKRAPMYWSSDPSDKGMCSGPPDMDEVTMKFPSEKEQEKDPLSLLNWFREVIRVRNAFPVIRRGTAEGTELSTDRLAVFWKNSDGGRLLIVMNFSEEAETAALSSLGQSFSLSAVLNTSEEKITLKDGTLTMPAYSIAVLTPED